MSDKKWRLHGRLVSVLHGDCLKRLKSLPDNSIDSCVTDPPYHLVSIVKRFGKVGKSDNTKTSARMRAGADGMARFSRGFAGKSWDGGDIAFRLELWQEVYRVLKPGAFLAAFGGTRSYHNMARAIERAGFEVRDQLRFDHETNSEIANFFESLNEEQQRQFGKLFLENGGGQLAWTYGKGFPKSQNVGKAFDNDAWMQWLNARPKLKRKLLDIKDTDQRRKALARVRKRAGLARPVVGARKGHDMRGGQLLAGKAGEIPITSAATPLGQKWEGWGTALKPAWEPICFARKPLSEKTVVANIKRWGTGAINVDACRVGDEQTTTVRNGNSGGNGVYGRDERSFTRLNPPGRFPANLCHDGSQMVLDLFPESKSTGGRRPIGHQSSIGTNVERDHREVFHFGDSGSAARFFYSAKAAKSEKFGSKHPTVKPIRLKQWLVRLTTPPGGTVLDLFAGTGTTGIAATIEGLNSILIEREDEYLADIVRRFKVIYRMDAQAIKRERNLSKKFDHRPSTEANRKVAKVKIHTPKNRTLFGSKA
jgi:DNA modification methylase